MNPAFESKLLQRGCLAVTVLFVIFVALALTVDRDFFKIAGFFLGGWVGVCWLLNRRERKRLNSAFESAFQGFGGPLPKLDQKFSYSFPSFTLTYADEESMKLAEKQGYLRAFKESIMKLYGHYGFEDQPFDADAAVWSTYIGWEPKFTEIG